MGQEKKNKRLAVILGLLIVVTTAFYFIEDSSDRVDVDRGLFSYNDPSQIDRVQIDLPEEQVQLSYDGQWRVGDYKADPQRIKVLFAVLQQLQVRRPVANQQQDSIQTLLKNEGVEVTFFEGETQVHSLKVLGNEPRGISYMSESGGGVPYLVEIPGYRSYLAGIFTVDHNGWRDPLVFDINWRNMQQVSVYYPDKFADFEILFDEGLYQVAGLQQTDTARLFNWLDDVSLLYVNDYLSEEEKFTYDPTLEVKTATIDVEDVGKNHYTLEVFGEIAEENAFLVRLDSTDFAVLPKNKLRAVLKPKGFFQKQNR